MSTKNKILEMLEINRGKIISGEEIASVLGISRSAIWKAMKSLKDSGYEIITLPAKGYILNDDNNILTIQSILPYLARKNDAEHISVYKIIDSTNTAAKKEAISGAPHGTVIIADTQTAGRGRYGRSFFSPPKTGLYMSLVIKLQNLNLPSAQSVTLLSAIAVCRAIKAVCNRDANIKWVNDIFYDGKKVCGISNESVIALESGTAEWVVIGIGVNVKTYQFPDNIGNIAGALSPDIPLGTARSKLAAEIINTLLNPEALEFESILNEYKSHLNFLGKIISVNNTVTNDCYDAVALDIDEFGGLIVRTQSNEIKSLSSGEIRIKLTSN
ncbi:MAG: biotin--[acetyl-CoA-carboxylase] ligase [Christensenellaceae bacterium]|jgi:BirA family biotin operon repressor/biotin-[acetyl-CoA-carboxylase] ligase|nr:biotin--[acetyl-CoA-carboxylase] ligase [Christensenellaceae bacterium]